MDIRITLFLSLLILGYNTANNVIAPVITAFASDDDSLNAPTFSDIFYHDALKYCDKKPECINLYLAENPGLDWVFNHIYWDTLNYEFNIQILPPYQIFHEGFPKNSDGSWMYGADNIYNSVGGEVLQARINYPKRTNNTCALKVSIALNNSGIDIPYIDKETLLGKNGKYYFLNVKALSIWMENTFPNFEKYKHNIDYINSAEVHNKIAGRKGIIISLYIHNDKSKISGHSDIYIGNKCSVSKSCSIAGNANILFWHLTG